MEEAQALEDEANADVVAINAAHAKEAALERKTRADHLMGLAVTAVEEGRHLEPGFLEKCEAKVALATRAFELASAHVEWASARAAEAAAVAKAVSATSAASTFRHDRGTLMQR
jgi:hypothetical protein